MAVLRGGNGRYRPRRCAGRHCGRCPTAYPGLWRWRLVDKGPAHAALEDGEHLPLASQAHFGLGGVDVDIHLLRRQRNV